MTLEECQGLKLEADLMARAAWERLRQVCLQDSTVGERATALAAVEGAERERQILMQMKVELIGSGKLLEGDLTETPSKAAQDAPGPVITAAALPGAPEAPAKAREAAVSGPTESLTDAPKP